MKQINASEEMLERFMQQALMDFMRTAAASTIGRDYMANWLVRNVPEQYQEQAHARLRLWCDAAASLLGRE